MEGQWITFELDPVAPHNYVMALQDGMLVGFISTSMMPSWVVSMMRAGYQGSEFGMILEPGIKFGDFDWEID